MWESLQSARKEPMDVARALRVRQTRPAVMGSRDMLLLGVGYGCD